MGFRLLPKSVTLSDLELRNGRVVCVISLNSAAFGAYILRKVVEANILSRSRVLIYYTHTHDIVSKVKSGSVV